MIYVVVHSMTRLISDVIQGGGEGLLLQMTFSGQLNVRCGNRVFWIGLSGIEQGDVWT
jgi:hypothetical protein